MPAAFHTFISETWVPGIKFCTKQLLRWGIVLYGFRLTLTEVAAVGIPAVAVDLVIVTVTIFGGVLLGRLLKIDRDTGLMTSTGSAICGARPQSPPAAQAGAAPDRLPASSRKSSLFMDVYPILWGGWNECAKCSIPLIRDRLPCRRDPYGQAGVQSR